MRAPLLASIFLCVACAPTLSQLVDDKHYREAICATAEGADDEDIVPAALSDDADLHLHAHRVTAEELTEAIGPDAARVHDKVELVRLRVRSNAVPVDSYDVRLSIVDELGQGASAPVSWASLAYATGEPLPPNRQESTYATGENALKALGAFFTLGLSLPFTEFRPGVVETSPYHADYLAHAPRATALYDAIGPSGCEAGPLGTGDYVRRSCDAFFVLDRKLAAAWEVRVQQSFGAKRIGVEEGDDNAACTVTLEHAVGLSALEGARLRRLVRAHAP